MYNLSREVKECLNLMMPAIVFFALPTYQQIEILPVLERVKKFDFPEGDLLTDNTLEVLVTVYETCLNQLLIRLTTTLEQSKSQDIENLESLVEELLTRAHLIVEYRFEEIGNVYSLDSSEWVQLRQLSEVVQQQLQIELQVNTKIIRDFIDAWLHV
jgi:hypothetical protein